MRKLFIILAMSASLAIATGCSSNTGNNTTATTEETTDDLDMDEEANPDYDPNRGEGKFTKVEVGDKLDGAMATSGEKVFNVKCSSCHKLTEEKLVGPGWLGLTKRRTPEWIMNFITNPDPMIDKDPELQAQLEICLVRMPNQNLTDDDARHILEFMCKNDGVQ